MDEIIINETKKVSAANHEAPEFLDSNYEANDLYQVDKTTIEETRENLTDVSVCLNTKRKIILNKKWNDMMHIYNNEVKNIAECNLLHDITNHPKRAKSANSH